MLPHIVGDGLLNRFHDGVDGLVDGYDERLLRTGFLQRLELTIEQVGIEEVVCALGQPTANEVPIPLQVDESRARVAVHQNRTVRPLQGRAGYDSRRAYNEPLVDEVVQRTQPRPPVLIRQGMPAAILSMLSTG